MKSNTNEPKNTDVQLEMELQEPISNKLYAVKSKLYFFGKYLEIKSYLRNPWIWCFIILTISMIAVQIYYLQTYISQLPDRVPLLTMYLNLERRLFEKVYLYAFPITSGLLLFIAFFTGTKTYYTNKVLALFSLMLTFIAALVLALSLIKIITYYHV